MIIDMRGSTWQIVKPILKVLQVFFKEKFTLIQTITKIKTRTLLSCYCRIIIVYGTSMFVDFMGCTCPQISIPSNVYQSNESSYITTAKNHLTRKLQPNEATKF